MGLSGPTRTGTLVRRRDKGNGKCVPHRGEVGNNGNFGKEGNVGNVPSLCPHNMDFTRTRVVCGRPPLGPHLLPKVHRKCNGKGLICAKAWIATIAQQISREGRDSFARREKQL